MLRSQSTDLLPMEIYGYIGRQLEQQQQQQYKHNISNIGYVTNAANQAFLIGSPGGSGSSASGFIGGGSAKKMVKQLSNASQQSSSSTSSSVQSAPSHIGATEKGQSPGRWSSHEHYLSTMQHKLPVHQEQQQQQQQQQQHQHYKQQLQLQQQLQQQSNITEDDTPKTSICESNSAASTSAASVASSYSDTTVEDGRIGGEDDISLTGSIKKRKRRLRFPFGRRKSNESNNSAKSKLA